MPESPESIAARELHAERRRLMECAEERLDQIVREVLNIRPKRTVTSLSPEQRTSLSTEGLFLAIYLTYRDSD